ncbi:glycosyltransferase family 2 protein [Actibacterium sp. 188UL27-1]|uniref:glycosyltransferase family 2 protein n=1 Tax=Actibacterium sp. 188UL27-1 TaxID=2786961 RepID=UPI0019596A30|nr:glycosyltransferase family 2 protein [Actibacterium sp. 188UL27-1]MBM7069107.1 glycosyltransferase family 2 protein [Actibacterium sp. 188UL27-1]
MFDITVIIAAWQADPTIDRSVDSALCQLDVSKQVVVIDDASHDGLKDRLSTRTDIELEALRVNGGPAAARNRGLDVARGTWVAVLDADDTMEPHRLRRMIDQAERQNADVILGNFRRVDEAGQPVDVQPFLDPRRVKHDEPVSMEKYVGRNQVRPNAPSLGYLKPIFRRSFLEAKGLRYNTELRNGEDCHLIFAFLAAGARVFIAPEPDYLYTVRSGSISHRANPEHISALINADKEFVNQFTGQLSSQVKRLFQSRDRALSQLILTERAMQFLKNRQVGDAISLLIRNPLVTGRVTRQLCESLTKRVDRQLKR